MEEPLIRFKGVSFRYTDRCGSAVNALSDVNVDIRQGEFVAIVGHNGSGKSTLAKHVNALLIPCEGTVAIKGFDTKEEKNLWEIRRTVGFVFQNPDNQIVASTVEEDVAFGPENMGLDSQEIRCRVDKAIEVVGMTRYMRHAPHLLSGGQKQRVAIAGALAMEPQCIVLDEPTAMLDPIGRADVLRSLARLREQKRTTLLLITHSMSEAVLADRVIGMKNGKVMMDGTPKEVFRQTAELKDMGLDIPQVSEVCGYLRQRGHKLSDDIVTVEELVDAICQLRSTM